MEAVPRINSTEGQNIRSGKLDTVTMRSLLLLAFLALELSAEPGPAVGARIPEFRLKDQDGKERTLKSIAGKKGAILVFYRSADW